VQDYGRWRRLPGLQDSADSADHRDTVERVLSANSDNSTRSLKRREVEKRRELIYQLHLKGWTQAEISESLKVAQSTVSDAIASVRDGNSWVTRASREKHSRLLQEIYDRTMLVIRESWRMFHDSKNADEPELRINLLGRVIGALNVLRPFVPDLEAVQLQQTVEQLLTRQKEIDEEQRLKQRVVHPLPSS